MLYTICWILCSRPVLKRERAEIHKRPPYNNIYPNHRSCWDDGDDGYLGSRVVAGSALCGRAGYPDIQPRQTAGARLSRRVTWHVFNLFVSKDFSQFFARRWWKLVSRKLKMKKAKGTAQEKEKPTQNLCFSRDEPQHQNLSFLY
jgi:hypothetical protein